MLSSLSKMSGSKDPLLFDIRLKTTDHDVLLIKGKENEASSVLLAGTIVLSVLEPIQIKTLSLRLVGRLRLNIPTNSAVNGVATKKYVKYEKRIFTHQWDEFNMDDYFDSLYDNYGNSSVSNSNGNGRSSPSLSISSSQKRSKSNTSLLSLSSNANYHTLVQGNYEFPFSAILPGSIVESVEGLPNAAVIYKLEAVISRPKMPDLICQKPLRVVRTLNPDAVELSETVAVENTWPKKVDYSISVPARAIAVGSATPIFLMIVPLAKDLRLGNIKITLFETSQYLGNVGGVISQERVVSKMKVKDPLGHLAEIRKRQKKKKDKKGDKNCDKNSDKNDNDNDDKNRNDDQESAPISFQDRWEIDTVLNIPPSLSKCTQDCDIFSNIKVRHKLKFNITLVNKDGHVSELRAALPIQLFISPFVAVGIKSTETFEKEENRKINTSVEDSNVNNTSFSSETFFHNSKEQEEDEDVIFASSASEMELHAGTLENNFFANTAISELMTPPNYGKHVYDRLWGDIPVTNTPLATRTASPVQNGRGFPELEDHSNDVDSSLNDSFSDLNLLRDSQATPLYLSTTNPFRDAQFPTFAVSDPDTTHFPTEMIHSPLVPHGFDQVSRSRTSSFSALPRQTSSTSLKKAFETAELSRLPTYDKAVKSDITGEDLPPTYPDNKSKNGSPELKGFNSPRSSSKVLLERPQSVRHRSSSFLSVASRQRSQASFNRSSNNSSSTSLNLLVRNNTGGSLTAPQANSHSGSFSKLTNSGNPITLSMTPVSPLLNRHTEEDGIVFPHSSHRSIPKVSSNSRQRSTSFPTFIDMFSKK